MYKIIDELGTTLAITPSLQHAIYLKRKFDDNFKTSETIISEIDEKSYYSEINGWQAN